MKTLSPETLKRCAKLDQLWSGVREHYQSRLDAIDFSKPLSELELLYCMLCVRMVQMELRLRNMEVSELES